MKSQILAANARYSTRVAQLLDELKLLDDGLLNRKPADGGWSAIQTMHHLILVEENSLAYIRKKLSFQPPLGKAGIGAWLRMRLLLLTLWSPVKFKAPKSAGSERIPDSDSFEATSARWNAIRAEWTTFFEEMPEALCDKAVYRHPRIGLINWLQMNRFIAAHFARHRKQIKRAVDG
ncbi:MAG: DinB family protein [Saprospiraceae bacterium]|nr:DinB family protein [Saprospiraceae bacterium]